MLCLRHGSAGIMYEFIDSMMTCTLSSGAWRGCFIDKATPECVKFVHLGHSPFIGL